jgi:Na+/melibiose symporter-like transporter
MDRSLQWSTTIAYGLTAVPLAMLGLPLYIYLPTFYADQVGLSVTAVGIILFVARLLDMISDPLIGYFSDRSANRFGRRKPYMVAGALILIASFYAIINPPGDIREIWLLSFAVLVYFGWSLMSIPYLAWSAEISNGYHEKTRLSASREISTIIGAVAALTLPYLYGYSNDAAKSLILLYIAFAAILLPLLTITLAKVPDTSRSSNETYSLSDIKKLWSTLPGLARLQSAFTLNNVANALPATLFLFYVEHVIDRPDLTGGLLLLYFISGIVGLPLWTFVAKCHGKRNSWLASILLTSFAFSFVPMLGAGDHLLFALICVVSGLSLGADMALPSSIQADVAQQARRQGDPFSGMLFGIWAMLTKFALALAVGTGFVILGMVGFKPDAPTQTALTALALLYGALPVVLKLLCFSIMRVYRETL